MTNNYTIAERVSIIEQYVVSSLIKNIHPILTKEEIFFLIEQAKNPELNTAVDLAIRNIRNAHAERGLNILLKAVEDDG